MAPGRRIPVGTTFSPQYVDLRAFLDAIDATAGDRAAMLQALWDTPVDKRGRQSPSPDMARHRIEAGQQYGLLDDALQPTAVTGNLKGLTDRDLYDAFARHMLLALPGLDFIHAVELLEAEGETVKTETVARRLSAMGVEGAGKGGNTKINTFRMWLAMAGIFPLAGNRWAVNSAERERIHGMAEADLFALYSLQQPAWAYLYALCLEDPPGVFNTSDLVDAAEQRLHGGYISQKNFSRDCLAPLERLGFLKLHARGTSRGTWIPAETTSKFKASPLRELFDTVLADADAAVARYFKADASSIFAVLDNPASSKNARGAALEKFAVLIMRRLGLRFVAWRARPKDLNFVEVDVVLAGVIGGLATRWQVQCKCTTTPVSDDVVLRELGLLPMTKATHVLILSTAGFTPKVRSTVKRWMRETSVAVYLFGDKEYEQLKRDPGAIPAIVAAQSRQIAQLERSGL